MTRFGTFNAHDHLGATVHALDLVDVLALQEAPPARVVRDQVDQLGRGRLQLAAGGKGIVTVWPVRWQLTASSWHRAHRGLATVSPARGTLVVRLDRHDGARLSVLNGHRVNGTGWPGVRRRHAATWRRRRWWRHAALDRRLVRAELAAGRTVVLCMDGNRTGESTPAPHPAAQLLTPGGSIDQVWLVEPGHPAAPDAVPAAGDAVRIAGSDHRLRRVTVLFRSQRTGALR